MGSYGGKKSAEIEVSGGVGGGWGEFSKEIEEGLSAYRVDRKVVYRGVVARERTENQ